MASNILTFDNPAFKAFVFYAVINLVKMVTLTMKTAFVRLTKHVYATPEDVKAFAADKDTKTKYDDEDVERVRRNHLNDLENIPLFIFLGLFFLYTGCSYSSALLHFRVFTVARLFYTICYQMVIPSPARSICFTVGMIVNMSMAVQILLATL